MELDELVNEVKNGNKDAYTELITAIQSDLYKIARARLSNEEDCKDAVQEAIINAYLSIGKLKNPKHFKTWITKILINECNHIYSKDKKKEEFVDKYSVSSETADYLNDNLDFENMLSFLDETQKKIFSLHYEDGLSIKQIAKYLKINENTVKTALSRGKLKIKQSYKPATIFAFILCILIATSVIAVSIISYIQSLFDLNDVGKDNKGVLMAIEHMDWYQQVDMNYIDLGDGYKIKVDYLLMDEMNLYMVFDLTSEKDISKYSDIILPDLKIIDENSNVICDESDLFAEQYTKKMSIKLIESNKNSIKGLIYMYTDSFPVSTCININFSKIQLSKKSMFSNNDYLDIYSNVDFNINLAEKFVNRNYVTYNSSEPEIEKAIITETGFYAIIEQNDTKKITEAKLIDEFGNTYDCYVNLLTNSDTSSILKNIIIANFNNKSKTLKLVINNKEYLLNIKE